MEEAREVGLLHLSPSSAKLQRLLNQATGELVDLPTDSCWSLKFCQNGFGILTPEDASRDGVWASTKLNLALVLGTSESGDTAVVFDKRARAKQAVDELQSQHVKGAYFHDDGFIEAALEVYIYTCKWPALGLVWWAMPHVVQLVVGSPGRSNWISEHMPALQQALHQVGFEQFHAQGSLKAAKAQIRVGSLVKPVCVDACSQEFAVSTCGLVVCLLYWHKCGLKGYGVDPSQQTLLLLSNLVDKFFTGLYNDFPIVLPDLDGSSITARCVNGKLHVDEQALADAGRSFWRLVWRSFSGEVPFEELLVYLYGKTRCASRASPASVTCAKEALKMLVELFGLIVDFAKDDSGWQQHVLAVAQLRGTKRLRRVSSGIKVALSVAAAKSKSLDSPGQVFAAAALLAEARGEEVVQPNPKLGASFVKEHMWQYWATGRQHHRGEIVDRLSFAIDGCRVSGEETLVVLGVATDLGIASVLPPQACMH